MENVIKVRHQRKRNADPLKANKRKAHVPCKSRPNTDVAVAQIDSKTDQAKTVVRGANPGAAAPGPAPPPPPLGLIFVRRCIDDA